MMTMMMMMIIRGGDVVTIKRRVGVIAKTIMRT